MDTGVRAGGTDARSTASEAVTPETSSESLNEGRRRHVSRRVKDGRSDHDSKVVVEHDIPHLSKKELVSLSKKELVRLSKKELVSLATRLQAESIGVRERLLRRRCGSCGAEQSWRSQPGSEREPSGEG